MISCTERLLRRLFFQEPAEMKEAKVDESRRALDIAKGDLYRSVAKLDASSSRLDKMNTDTQHRLLALARDMSAEMGRR